MTRLRYNNHDDEDTFTTGGSFMTHLALKVVLSPDGQLESLRILRIVVGCIGMRQGFATRGYMHKLSFDIDETGNFREKM